jgi:hypothetical protein
VRSVYQPGCPSRRRQTRFDILVAKECRLIRDELLHDYGGAISVENEEGKGSTRLPLARLRTDVSTACGYLAPAVLKNLLNEASHRSSTRSGGRSRFAHPRRVVEGE